MNDLKEQASPQCGAATGASTMIKQYISFIKNALTREHFAKMEMAVILFCLLTILLGPPPAPRLNELLESQASTQPQGIRQKQVVFEQIPPPELPYFVKE